MKIKDVLWFTSLDKTIGIVKNENGKCYIGVAKGINEQDDINTIANFGSPVTKDVLLRFFKEVKQ